METVVALFDRQVARAPDAVAVRTPAGVTSYGQLSAAADRVVAELRARGVAADAVVGLPAPRTGQTLAAVLGALRHGVAYVPLDPADPPERRARIAADAGCAVVLGASGPPAPVRVPPAAGVAYVLYTSGSTGTPKGVLVSRAALGNYVRAAIGYLDLTVADRVLWSSRAAFDASVEEFLPALCAGASVAVPDDRTPLRRTLFSAAGLLGATVVPLPAAVVNALGFGLLRRLRAAGVRLVVSGGSALDSVAVRRVPPGLRVLNTYGPTEATVVATTYLVPGGSSAAVPIGRPVPGVRAYVLDAGLDPVDEGQLYLAGESLADGYVGRPAATAAAFLPDPYGPSPGARMYATGDRVRRLPDAQLGFLGRIDDQLEVHGHRIEPGEIEHALRRCAGVTNAAVGVDGTDALVGYVVAASWDPAAVRDQLAARLPARMVPTRLVPVAALPLTARGKLDRAALRTLG